MGGVDGRTTGNGFRGWRGTGEGLERTAGEVLDD